MANIKGTVFRSEAEIHVSFVLASLLTAKGSTQGIACQFAFETSFNKLEVATAVLGVERPDSISFAVIPGVVCRRQIDKYMYIR